MIDRRGFIASLSAALAVAGATKRVSAADEPFNVLVLGDSIAWGQGLAPAHRWRTLLEDRVRATTGRTVYEIPSAVHSGATIGIGDLGDIEERPRDHVARELYTPAYADPTATNAAGAATDTFERSLLHADPSAAVAPYDGEIPSATPTVLRQLDAFDAGPDRDRRVDLVLLSAGINDVSVTRLLDPLADRRYVRDAIDAHCRHHLVVLLDRIRARIVAQNPACTVVVLSYYPMIGPKSLAVPSTRELLAVLTTPPSETRKQRRARMFESDAAFVTGSLSPDAATNALDAARPERPQSALVRALVAAADRFYALSETAIGRAVDEANRKPFSANFVHVTPGIDPDRTVFAKDAELWSLRGASLAPEDDVAQPRAEICRDLGGKNGDLTPNAVRQCFIASLGHPNDAGAERYAESIWTALEPRLPR